MDRVGNNLFLVLMLWLWLWLRLSLRLVMEAIHCEKETTFCNYECLLKNETLAKMQVAEMRGCTERLTP